VCVCVNVRGRICADYVKPNAVLKHDSFRARATSPRRVPTTPSPIIPRLFLLSPTRSFHPRPIIDVVRFVFLISSARRPSVPGRLVKTDGR